METRWQHSVQKSHAKNKGGGPAGPDPRPAKVVLHMLWLIGADSFYGQNGGREEQEDIKRDADDWSPMSLTSSFNGNKNSGCFCCNNNIFQVLHVGDTYLGNGNLEIASSSRSDGDGQSASDDDAISFIDKISDGP